MNCDALRNQLLEAPEQSDPALEQHLAACPACANFQQRLLESTQGFRAISAPALRTDFSQAVMQRVSLSAQKRRRSVHRVFAIAALLVSAVGIGLVARSPWSEPEAQLTDAQRKAISEELQMMEFRPLYGVDCGLPGGHCRLANPEDDAKSDQLEG
ncbi:MAG: hypothetical protein AB8B96_11965 [Lysobacterales bacterium]